MLRYCVLRYCVLYRCASHSPTGGVMRCINYELWCNGSTPPIYRNGQVYMRVRFPPMETKRGDGGSIPPRSIPASTATSHRPQVQAPLAQLVSASVLWAEGHQFEPRRSNYDLWCNGKHTPLILGEMGVRFLPDQFRPQQRLLIGHKTRWNSRQRMVYSLTRKTPHPKNLIII